MEPDESILLDLLATGGDGAFASTDEASTSDASTGWDGGDVGVASGGAYDEWCCADEIAAHLAQLACFQCMQRRLANAQVVVGLMARVEFVRMLQREASEGGLAEACAAGVRYLPHDWAAQTAEHGALSIDERQPVWLSTSVAVRRATFHRLVRTKYAAVAQHQQWMRVLTRQRQRMVDTGGDRAGLPPLAAAGASVNQGTNREFDYLIQL